MFGKLFGNKHEGSQARILPGSARTISYDIQLIDSLKRDHEELVRLYTRIGELLAASRFNEIRAELINFKTRFEAHVLTENVRFYTYLEQSHSDDVHNTELIRDFRREMNTIARGAVGFVKRYQFGDFDESQRAQFVEDYQSVGALLSHRIEREEASLYPLYAP